MIVILIFAAINFGIASIVYRHQFTHLYHTSRQTGGMLLKNAVLHIFTGLFIFQLTFVGIMFLREAFAYGITATVLFVLTVFARFYISSTFFMNTRFMPVGGEIIEHPLAKAFVKESEEDEKSLTEIEGDSRVSLGGDRSPKDSYGVDFNGKKAWIPCDKFGVSCLYINDLKNQGVECNDQDTSVDEKGHIIISEPIDVSDD